MELAELLIEKGDILIWHASLAHRGTIVKNPDLTRLSLLVHYSSERGYTRDRRAPNAIPVRYFELVPVASAIPSVPNSRTRSPQPDRGARQRTSQGWWTERGPAPIANVCAAYGP